MKLSVYMRSRKGEYHANGTYEDGSLTVHSGSVINLHFADHVRNGNAALSYRNNPEYVDLQGNVLKDCLFSSPSPAAQFVNGRSTNGFIAWRVDDEYSLKRWLSKEKVQYND